MVLFYNMMVFLMKKITVQTTITQIKNTPTLQAVMESEMHDVCEGKLDYDQDVDATDVTKFLEDFGRNAYNNPCPECVMGW